MEIAKLNIVNLVEAISQMQIEKLELLPAHNLYSGVRKSVFIRKINQVFDNFKRGGDTFLNCYAGECNMDCGQDKTACSGFCFVGNKTHNYMSVLIKTDNDGIKDIFNCSELNVRSLKLDLKTQFKINFYNDEKAWFNPSPLYESAVQNCKKAVDEIHDIKKQILCIKDYSHWVKKYEQLFKSLHCRELNPTLNSDTRYFHDIYYGLNGLVESVSCISKARKACELYEKYSTPQEKLDWSKQFELLGRILYLFKYKIENQEGHNFFRVHELKINADEFEWILSFKVFQDQYIISKYVRPV